MPASGGCEGPQPKPLSNIVANNAAIKATFIHLTENLAPGQGRTLIDDLLDEQQPLSGCGIFLQTGFGRCAGAGEVLLGGHDFSDAQDRAKIARILRIASRGLGGKDRYFHQFRTTNWPRQKGLSGTRPGTG
jgi:hypothetical protein